MKTIAELLKHDFKKGSLYLYDSNKNEIYYENSGGYLERSEYDSNGNRTYLEDSDGFWCKQKFGSENNLIYSETSKGNIIDNRPKPSCEGKVVEIDGKKYKLVELNK